jgi:hypothetical protein
MGFYGLKGFYSTKEGLSLVDVEGLLFRTKPRTSARSKGRIISVSDAAISRFRATGCLGSRYVVREWRSTA